MKYNARIFVVRDNRCALQGSRKQVCLNTPGRAAPFFVKGVRLVSQPPTGLICLSKKRDHVPRNSYPRRNAAPGAHPPGITPVTNRRLAAVLPPALLPLTH